MGERARRALLSLSLTRSPLSARHRAHSHTHTQPLTAEEAAALTAAAATAPGASAWNAAGTWEDRDVSAAAKAALTARLVGLQVATAGGGGGVTITALPSISGDGASVTFVRGSRRAGFDFDVTLEWAADGGAATGTARLPNVASDELEELAVVEVAVVTGGEEGGGGGRPPAGLGRALAAAVGAALSGLAAELAEGA